MSANFLRKSLYAASLLVLSGAVAFSPLFQPLAVAQSTTSGDIAGVITDTSGAAIPNATITIVSKTTAATKSLTSSGSGAYRASLLQPGSYTVRVEAAGFDPVITDVDVAAGGTASANLKLTVGTNKQTIEVTSAAPLLQTENADVSTSFSMEQTQNLPNPGNDITFYAQTVPGAVMNTQGGYGNFEVFGLPATSNNFTLNGGQEDDPFLNLNNSGPSNLLLGNNDIAEVNVITNAYSSEYGSFGGAQVVETSRAGGNRFHGNVNYWYNGAVLNANNYFLNQGGNSRPGDVDNQWAAAIGGPIFKDKTFFFVDYEGIRFTTSNTGDVFAPSPSFEATTLAKIAGNANPEVQSELPFYQSMFNFYNNAPNYNPANVTTDPDVVQFSSVSKLALVEKFIAGRIDQNFGPNDKMFFHVKYDEGLQPTYSDPISPIFDANSEQPDYEAQLGFTHSFSPSTVNQLLLSGSYYGAIFRQANPTAVAQQFPETLDFIDGSFTGLGGESYAFPQGRNVTQYQVQDDFSRTMGAHTVKVGGFFKRDDVSDFDQQQFTTPLLFAEKDLAIQGASADGVNGCTLPGGCPAVTNGTFQNGGVFEAYGSDKVLLNPSAGNQPVSVYNLGVYIEDDWKPLPNLQINVGIRFERDSRPYSVQNNFVRTLGDFADVSNYADTVNDPYDSFISPGHGSAFVNYSSFMPEPRFGFTWSPAGSGSKTVLRGGFGMFTDIFPGVISDSLFGNYPFALSTGTIPDNAFLYGRLASGGYATGVSPTQPVTTNLIDPFLPDSSVAEIQNTGAIYKNGFGNSYAQLGGSSPCPACVGLNAGISQPSFTNVNNQIHYPTYQEWSLQVQHQINNATSFMVGYVGNHGYHEPIQNANLNAYDGAFAGLPTSPTLGGFRNFNQIETTGSSNYNGLVTSIVNRSRYLTLQFNYTYSHTLDEISNGGLSPFSFGSGVISQQLNPFNLSNNYGNADYDSRHVINGSYVWTLPYWGGPRIMTDGWQITGTAFFNSGYPFTLMDSAATPYAFGENYNTNLPATIDGPISHRCGKSGAVGNSTGTPCAALLGGYNAAGGYTLLNGTTLSPATSFGNQERNQFVGPRYFDTDLAVNKAFKLPWEGVSVKLGAQFFNILNHPNFSNPGADVNATGFGTIGSMANPPTSIFGAFLGGDAAPRLIQFKGSINF